MNKNKAEVIATFIIGYFVLLVFCFLIYFLYGSLIGIQIIGKMTDSSAFFIGLLGWSATLYAPLIAIFLFTDWKEQKKFEVGKQYAENTIKIVTNINKTLENAYFSIKPIEDLIEFYLGFNSSMIPDALSKINETINYIEETKSNYENYISIHIDADILVLIMEIDNLKKLIDKYEQVALNLQSAMDILNKNILKSIESELVKIYKTDSKNIKNNSNLLNRLCKSLMKTKITIENKSITNNKILTEYFSEYEKTYKELLNTLTRLIKI